MKTIKLLSTGLALTALVAVSAAQSHSDKDHSNSHSDRYSTSSKSSGRDQSSSRTSTTVRSSSSDRSSSSRPMEHTNVERGSVSDRYSSRSSDRGSSDRMSPRPSSDRYTSRSNDRSSSRDYSGSSDSQKPVSRYDSSREYSRSSDNQKPVSRYDSSREYSRSSDTQKPVSRYDSTREDRYQAPRETAPLRQKDNTPRESNYRKPAQDSTSWSQSQDSKPTYRSYKRQNPTANNPQNPTDTNKDKPFTHSRSQDTPGRTSRYDNRPPQQPVLERFGHNTSNFAVQKDLVRTPMRGFDRPSSVFIHKGLGNQVLNQERISLQSNGFRVGYYQYQPSFHDNWFFYGNYCYAPTYVGSVCSPWYYYCELPPYFYSPTVIVIGDYPHRHHHYGRRAYEYTYLTTYGGYDNYDNYNSYDNYDRNPNSIDGSLNSIVSGFEHRSFRSLNYLVPHNGNVAIFMDHEYRYSINSDDFYDMLRDAVENVDTKSYHILSVNTFDDDSVRLEARHETVDPWGNRTNVYNTILLERENDGYVIREFGTSRDRD